MKLFKLELTPPVRALSAFALMLALPLAANAAGYAWTGGGGDGSWTNPANWGCTQPTQYPHANDTADFPALDEPIVVYAPENATFANNWIKVRAGGDVTIKNAGASSPMKFSSMNDFAGKLTIDGVDFSFTSTSEQKPLGTAEFVVKNGGSLSFASALTPSSGAKISVESGGTISVAGDFNAKSVQSISLSGKSALRVQKTLYLRPWSCAITIDDSIFETSGFCLGDVKPGGGTISFRGENPVFRVYGGNFGYWVYDATMTEPVVFDYMVPAGGYAEAPFQFLNLTGTQVAFGTAPKNLKAGKFVVNADSPALSAGTALDTPLALSKTGFLRTLTDITDTTAALRLVDATNSGTEPTTDAEACGIRAVIGVGTPVVPTVAVSKVDEHSAITVARRKLTAMALVTACSTVAAKTEVRLWAGETEDDLAVVASREISSAGFFSIEWTAPEKCLNKTYCTKIEVADLDASGAVLLSSATPVKPCTTLDTTVYTWTGAGENDLWSNPANWTGDQGEDRLDCPQSAEATAKFTTDCEVTVDGLYAAKLSFNATKNVTMKLKGSGVDASKVTAPSFSVPTTGSSVVLDNVFVDAVSSAVKLEQAGSSLQLRNGAKFVTTGALTISKDDAFIDLEGESYFGSSDMTMTKGRLRIKDSDYELKGTLTMANAASATATIRFEGTHPVFHFAQNYQNCSVGNATGRGNLDFVVPPGGFDAPPITTVPNLARNLGDRASNVLGDGSFYINIIAETATLMASAPTTTAIIDFAQPKTNNPKECGIATERVVVGSLPTADAGHAVDFVKLDDSYQRPTLAVATVANVYCNALEVLGAPENWGTPEPTYGKYANLTEGSRIELRAPDAAFDIAAETRARFAGWRLFRADAEGQFVLEDEAETNQYDYVHASGATCRFEWKLKRVYPLTLTAVGDGTSDLYVSGSLAQPGTPIWFDEGTEVEIAAVPQDGSRFAGWGADVVRTAGRTITIDGPTHKTAYSLDKHTYGSDSYVRDGLVLQLDGIDNAGFGLHDGTRQSWLDLAGTCGPVSSSVAGGSWTWREDALAIARTDTNMMIEPTLPLNFNDVTFEIFSDLLDDSTGDGTLLWASPDTGRATIELRKKAGTDPKIGLQAPGDIYFNQSSIAYQNGAHTFRLSSTEGVFWQDDESVFRKGFANAATNGLYASAIKIGNYSNSRANSALYAVRVYNRQLTDDEVRWNAAVDKARFYGGAVQTGEVTVRSLAEQVAAPAPGYGTWTIGLTTNNVFVLGGLVTDDFDGARVAAEFHGSDIRYVYGGYEWTKGLFDVESGSGTAESVALIEPSLFNSVTWKFTKEFRTVVTTDEGGTVTVSPGVTGTSVTNWAAGGTITVSATPDAASGYRFLRWTGDLDGIADFTSPTIEVPVTNRTLNATYAWEDPAHEPVTTAWKAGAASGDWNDAENWDNGVPQKGDTVVISNVTADTTIVFDRPTATLGLLAVGGDNGKTVTLVCNDWSAKVTADTIDLGAGAVVTCGDPFSWGDPEQRVFLGGGDLIVRAGARIHADARGYKGANGYCWPNGKYSGGTWGGSYGGKEGRVYADNAHVYGDPAEPVQPGSGGGGIAGGAVRLDFTGDVVVDGEVSACAQQQTWNDNYCTGSGGGIWIDCRTISGAGFVKANSRDPWSYRGRNNLSGGGGRVAVHYDSSAQRSVSCDIRFEARGGAAVDHALDYTASTGSMEANIGEWLSRPGTLWFTDNLFLERAAAAGVLTFSGVWVSPVPIGSLSFPNGLTVDRVMPCFDEPGLSISVSGDLTATGFGYYARRNNGLSAAAADITVSGDVTLAGARLEMLSGGSLTVGGRLVQTRADVSGDAEAKGTRYDGGLLSVHAAASDAADAVGAQVTVGGTWSMATNCVVFPFCEPTNGAYVAFKARALRMDEGSLIDATQRGYDPKQGPGAPSGTSASIVGASHGGRGGAPASAASSVAEPYGSLEEPCEPGSGSFPSNGNGSGFSGGGVVWLEIARTFTLNGQILADGNWRQFFYMNGGTSASSGGSICIKAHRLRGNGLTGGLFARGGVVRGQKIDSATPNTDLSAGGGGRIAVWCGVNEIPDFDTFKAERISVGGGVRVSYTTANGCSILGWLDKVAEDGTVYFGDLPMPGLMLLVR